MRAVVNINGKQYPVEEGRYVKIDSFDAKENESLTLSNVIMVIAGEHSLIGAPYIEGAAVKATVKRHGRDGKILVYKMRCKKGYRRKNGHRQGFTELQIESVDFPGKDKIMALVPKTEYPERKRPEPKAAVATPAKKAEPKAPKTPKAAVPRSEAEPKAAIAEPEVKPVAEQQPVVTEEPKAPKAPKATTKAATATEDKPATAKKTTTKAAGTKAAASGEKKATTAKKPATKKPKADDDAASSDASDPS